jgi:hypothetical protein
MFAQAIMAVRGRIDGWWNQAFTENDSQTTRGRRCFSSECRTGSGATGPAGSPGSYRACESKTVLSESGFELTSRGEAFANPSAAKPVFRKTAETLLQQFLERKRRSFGSMLSEAERLGDVDIAIELLPKVTEEARLLTMLLQKKRLTFALEEVSHTLATMSEGKGMSGRDLKSWIGRAEQKALLRAIATDGPQHFALMIEDFDSLETTTTVSG